MLRKFFTFVLFRRYKKDKLNKKEKLFIQNFSTCGKGMIIGSLLAANFFKKNLSNIDRRI